MKDKKTILITGGAGFIGSHLVRKMVTKYEDYHIINIDALTYAGNLANLTDIEDKPNYTFIKADITDDEGVNAVFSEYNIEGVIHLAAESHVDRSIHDPLAFAKTNILGTMTLLNAAKKHWEDFAEKRFYHVSTDEVYGTLGLDGLFSEKTPYAPNSPYSASKASSDHFVRAYGETYGLPYVISNCSNNYGPNQFPEKLIPLFINNIVNKKDLPVYGTGENVRDWLYVEDHVEAIDMIYHQGKNGETYNIGGLNEWKNIDLVKKLIEVTDQELGRKKGDSLDLITFVKDRAGHDLRYAIDCSKLQHELDWAPKHTFGAGLKKTVQWYLENATWLSSVTSGDYVNYYENMYEGR